MNSPRLKINPLLEYGGDMNFRAIMAALIYLAMGIITLCVAVLVDKKMKLELFWEYNCYNKKWTRCYAEVPLVVAWPLFVLMASCWCIFKIFTGITSMFIKDPNKTELCRYLESRGYDENDVEEIKKEMPGLLDDTKE
jgi:hypothetical protein